MNSASTSPGIKEQETHSADPAGDLLLDRVYHLVLWNDDVTPVTLVIHLLMTLLGYSQTNAITKTLAVESSGKGVIYTGSLELCELRHEQFGEAKITTTIELV